MNGEHLYILFIANYELIQDLFYMSIVNINLSRASSPTRTLFRLNTNQGHAYENCVLNNISPITYTKMFNCKIKLIAHTPFSAWRVVSTWLRVNSPCCDYTRLLVIPNSCSRISDYNPIYILFWGLAQVHTFASLCRGTCSTSIAHSVKVMMTCISPYYIIHYIG